MRIRKAKAKGTKKCVIKRELKFRSNLTIYKKLRLAFIVTQIASSATKENIKNP